MYLYKYSRIPGDWVIVFSLHPWIHINTKICSLSSRMEGAEARRLDVAESFSLFDLFRCLFFRPTLRNSLAAGEKLHKCFLEELYMCIRVEPLPGVCMLGLQIVHEICALQLGVGAEFCVEDIQLQSCS